MTDPLYPKNLFQCKCSNELAFADRVDIDQTAQNKLSDFE